MGLRMTGLAVVAALALGGCNFVITPAPVLTKADSVGGAPLKEGLWAQVSPDCDVDFSKPVTTWPECAEWTVVKDGQFQGKKESKSEGGGKTKASEKLESLPFVLGAGEPRVLQMGVKFDKVEDKEAAALLGEAIYFYLGLRPVKSDPDGKITEYGVWALQCGKPPAKGEKDAEGAPKAVTDTPLPDVTMRKDSMGCTVKDAAALRRVAAASKDWDVDDISGRTVRWVRATYP